MQDPTQEDSRLINTAMELMIKAHNGDYAKVFGAIEKIIPIITKPACESSREDIEFMIKTLFNTQEIRYEDIRKFTKLVTGDDSPPQVIAMLNFVLEKPHSKASDVVEDNPFANIEEIDV